jgi:hypothetical protein
MPTRFKNLCVILIGWIALAAVAGGALLATNAFAQSAREVRGPTPYLAVENEPPPKLIVDPALAAGLAQGIVWIQYRAENVRILPVFGAGALNVSPRPGQHKVLIELVNANHQVFSGCATCSQTVTFTVPETKSRPH